jgi:hypothetical protein
MAWKSPAEAGLFSYGIGQRLAWNCSWARRDATTGLEPREAGELADAIAEAVGSPGATYSA